MTDFDCDPEALAWARTKAQAYIDRLAAFEQQANEQGDRITQHGCGVARLLAERHFLGDGGCTIGVFDERLPDIIDGRRDEPARTTANNPAGDEAATQATEPREAP